MKLKETKYFLYIFKETLEILMNERELIFLRLDVN